MSNAKMHMLYILWYNVSVCAMKIFVIRHKMLQLNIISPPRILIFRALIKKLNKHWKKSDNASVKIVGGLILLSKIFFPLNRQSFYCAVMINTIMFSFIKKEDMDVHGCRMNHNFKMNLATGKIVKLF